MSGRGGSSGDWQTVRYLSQPPEGVAQLQQLPGRGLGLRPHPPHLSLRQLRLLLAQLPRALPHLVQLVSQLPVVPLAVLHDDTTNERYVD